MAFAAALTTALPGAAAATDYACNFVEVQCDRAANLVRVVPFRAENEECDRLRAVKDADWLVDVARHLRAGGKDRKGPGAAKVVRCDLGEGRTVAASVQGAPVDARMQGPCGAVFSAIVTIDEVRPRPRRVVNEINLLQSCETGGAADRIEYFPDSQKVLIQWSSEPRFGVLERTVLARQSLKRNGR
ncbi:MAG: hypothetical protein U1F37_10490 [Alphaproteobacteria bacterium]